MQTIVRIRPARRPRVSRDPCRCRSPDRLDRSVPVRCDARPGTRDARRPAGSTREPPPRRGTRPDRPSRSRATHRSRQAGTQSGWPCRLRGIGRRGAEPQHADAGQQRHETAEQDEGSGDRAHVALSSCSMKRLAATVAVNPTIAMTASTGTRRVEPVSAASTATALMIDTTPTSRAATRSASVGPMAARIPAATNVSPKMMSAMLAITTAPRNRWASGGPDRQGRRVPAHAPQWLRPLGVEDMEIDPAGVGVDVDHGGARRDSDCNRDQHHVGPSVAGQIDTDDRFLGVVGQGDDLIGDIERRHDEVLADDRTKLRRGLSRTPPIPAGPMLRWLTTTATSRPDTMLAIDNRFQSAHHAATRPTMRITRRIGKCCRRALRHHRGCRHSGRASRQRHARPVPKRTETLRSQAGDQRNRRGTDHQAVTGLKDPDGGRRLVVAGTPEHPGQIFTIDTSVRTLLARAMTTITTTFSMRHRQLGRDEARERRDAGEAARQQLTASSG